MLAGVRGTAGVKAIVTELTEGDEENPLELQGLPFQGNVLVGRKF